MRCPLLGCSCSCVSGSPWHALCVDDAARAAVPPVPPHLFATPHVVVSPRRVMDVPDEPGAEGQDFPGAVS